MNPDFIRERITELRLKKDVSEHRMSLDLGHARSYVHGIVCGRTLPSMSEFLLICDYFEISPEHFFKPELKGGNTMTKLLASAEQLEEQDLKLLSDLAERLAGKN